MATSNENSEDNEYNIDENGESFNRPIMLDPLNIKEEAPSPSSNGDHSVEIEAAENNETNFESVENVICIKKEISEERNDVNLDQDPISIHKDIYIKEENISEEASPMCNIPHCEEISNATITKNSKKSSKRSCFNFSTDCTEVLHTKKAKQKNVCEVDQLMQSAMDGLQILQNHMKRPNYDHIDAFMHYIAAELREIKCPLNLMKAKQSIFNVVYELRRQDLE